MLLLDSLYINNSGGKVLLDYLVDELLHADVDVFYLFDERCRNDYKLIPDDQKLYLKASLLNRYRFYRQHQHTFSKVFCFANNPPPIKLENAKVYTYFHNILWVNIPKQYPLKTKIKIFVLNSLMKMYKHNTDFWIVQSNLVKEKLNDNLNLSTEKTKVLPFFKLEDLTYLKKSKHRNSFCYISTGASHKNHQRLLEAWAMLSDKGITPTLHLTIPNQNKVLLEKIRKINSDGANIINHGVISKEQVNQIYCLCEFLVYPSLAESFGLPLIEAVNAGCKVVAADLEYVDEAVATEIKFNPYDSLEIANKVEYCCFNKIQKPTVIIQNKVNELLNLLS